MNSEEHKKSAELLLAQIPHDVGVLLHADIDAIDTALQLAAVHVELAKIPDPEELPEFDAPADDGGVWLKMEDDNR